MLNPKTLTLVKIGGSLITDKKKPFTVRRKALDKISLEVKRAYDQLAQNDEGLVVAHGAGSFAHVPAKRYQTHRGILNEESYFGLAEVAATARRLNQVVMESLLHHRVRAVAVSPLSIMTAHQHELASICDDSLRELLKLGMLPVLYGDQIIDTKIGCTVFSTEKVLATLALHLQKKGYHIKRIIHCGQTNGVYDESGQTIPMINSRNFKDYQQALREADGADVTGGMMHKVEETLKLARQGIPGLIIDGIVNGSLSSAISGLEVVGTKVEK